MGIVILGVVLFGSIKVNEERGEGVRKNGGVVVCLPIKGEDRGKATIKLEIIDVEDKVLSSVTKEIEVQTKWKEFKFFLPYKGEDLFFSRLRYELTTQKTKKEGTIAFSELLNYLEGYLFSSLHFVKNEETKLKIVAINHKTKEGIKGARVEVLWDDEVIFRGRTGKGGILEAKITPKKEGKFLKVIFNSPIGGDTIVGRIKMKEGVKLYLTTDKPVYQPGQKIYFRCIALKENSLLPLQGAKLIVEIKDPKGNKVFRFEEKTNSFGIIGGEFKLAEEVNLGRYEIKGRCGKLEEIKTIRVDRYKLPKIKISLQTDKKFYSPGEVLKGKLLLEYFYGEKLDFVDVEVVGKKFDIEFSEFTKIEGKTNRGGEFSFEMKLPDYFVGIPLEKEEARVWVEVKVEDKSKYIERKSFSYKIVKTPVKIEIIPEGGKLVRGVENRIYLMITYPDGKVAKGVRVKGKVGGEDFAITTDEGGVGEIKFIPKKVGEVKIEGKAYLSDEKEVRFSDFIESKVMGLVLRVNRVLYKVGEVLVLKTISTQKKGVVYLDVVKNNQIVMMKREKLLNGSCVFRFPLTPELVGGIWVSVYMIEGNGNIVRDRRFIYVDPANDLNIEVKTNKKVYSPGEEVTIQFRVKDKKNHPLKAAIGVAIVDEAVFSVSEVRPGLEKMYFLIEREILKPKWEIHQLMEKVVRNGGREFQRLAKVNFAKVVSEEGWSWCGIYKQKIEFLKHMFEEKVRRVSEMINSAVKKYYNIYHRYPEDVSFLVNSRLLEEKYLKDPWGEDYELKVEKDLRNYELISYGPDKKRGTIDDIRIKNTWWKSATFRPMVGAEEWVSEARYEEKVVLFHKAKKVTLKGRELRVRRYFPETLFFLPSLLTDENGFAQIKFQLGDAITTWRMSVVGVGGRGEFGGGNFPLKVFQPFFVEIDLPIALTTEDEIGIPIRVYNYSEKEEKIIIKIKKDNWFQLLEETEEKQIKLDKRGGGVVYFTLKVKEVGTHKLRVEAWGKEVSDAIEREVVVLPNGKLVENGISGRVSTSVEKNIIFPSYVIPDVSSLHIRIHPGVVSQIVQGLSHLLRMPFGCFEQTTSITYPNVLVLNYMRKNNLISPEIEMKAENFIVQGYQRLLTFEVEGGGFSWFGNSPANKLLTAYGLMEFSDMAKVYEIDENLVEKIGKWLLGLQEEEGKWVPDEEYLHLDVWGKLKESEVLVTSFIVWSLLEAGFEGKKIEKAINYIETHMNTLQSSYGLAICANALTKYDKNRKSSKKIINKLKSKAKREGKVIWWEGGISSFTHSDGEALKIETTALACLALLKTDEGGEVLDGGIKYLIQNKHPQGGWISTQGTVWALKTLVEMKEEEKEARGEVIVKVDEKEVKRLKITEKNWDVVQECWVGKLEKGEHKVEINFNGEGSVFYDIGQKFYIPWEMVPPPLKEFITIQVDYDKKQLAQNDIVKVGVRILNNLDKILGMIIVDLGIPPGFDVLVGDLEEVVQKGIIARYNLTPRQIIVYLEALSPREEISFTYRLRARLPLKVKGGMCRVYEYYHPSNEEILPPFELKVE